MVYPFETSNENHAKLFYMQIISHTRMTHSTKMTGLTSSPVFSPLDSMVVVKNATLGHG